VTVFTPNTVEAYRRLETAKGLLAEMPNNEIKKKVRGNIEDAMQLLNANLEIHFAGG
jgi:hypothetical protein